MRFTQVSDETAESYRDKLDTVVVCKSNMAEKHGSKHGKSLHIPGDSEELKPLCNAVSHEDLPFVEKDTAVYPPGHKSICKRCVAMLENDLSKWTDEQLLANFRLVKERVEFDNVSREIYDDYRDKDQPSGATLISRFGSWSEARDKL